MIASENWVYSSSIPSSDLSDFIPGEVRVLQQICFVAMLSGMFARCGCRGQHPLVEFVFLRRFGHWDSELFYVGV